MVTKEHKLKTLCCFYVSDFHLEMILLPYIKSNIDKSKFVIFTEKNLSESIKILLDRTNLDFNEKNKILDLNWNGTKVEELANYDFTNHTIIVNGSSNYILKISQKLKDKKINRIDCYNINEKNLNLREIKEKYDEMLNTKNR